MGTALRSALLPRAPELLDPTMWESKGGVAALVENIRSGRAQGTHLTKDAYKVLNLLRRYTWHLFVFDAKADDVQNWKEVVRGPQGAATRTAGLWIDDKTVRAVWCAPPLLAGRCALDRRGAVDEYQG